MTKHSRQYRALIAQNRQLLVGFVIVCLCLGLYFVLRSNAAVCEGCEPTPGLKIFDATGSRTATSDWVGDPEKLTGLPDNLTSPVDYTAGHAYARIEVLEKPSTVNTVIIFCANDQYFNERCSYKGTEYAIQFTVPGVYYADLGKPQDWQQVSAGRYTFDGPMYHPYLQFVDKDHLDQIIANGADPNDLNFDEEVKAVLNGFYYNQAQLSNHLPIKVKAEIYMTAANTYFVPPANWDCPATVCPATGATATPTGGPTPTPTTNPTPTTPPTPTPTALPSGTDNPGDIDGDGHATFTDLTILVVNYKKTGVSRQQGDLDGDGTVTIFDLSRLVKYWGT